MASTMMLESKVALTAAGVFFTTALFTGVWKYRHMLLTEGHVAPFYVDTAHRAALLSRSAGRSRSSQRRSRPTSGSASRIARTTSSASGTSPRRGAWWP
jgi:hypothetical protein